jgi:hypothetical protein
VNQSMTEAKPTDDEEPPADLGLDAKAMEAIGRALRAHYDDLVTSPLPDRFNELMARLGGDAKTAPEDGTAPKSEKAPEGRANAAG